MIDPIIEDCWLEGPDGTRREDVVLNEPADHYIAYARVTNPNDRRVWVERTVFVDGQETASGGQYQDAGTTMTIRGGGSATALDRGEFDLPATVEMEVRFADGP